jgi:hypothetical protein
MGEPGVGKGKSIAGFQRQLWKIWGFLGTYASLLSGWLGYEHVSTGDAIRERIRAGAPEGIRYQKYVEHGDIDSAIFS